MKKRPQKKLVKKFTKQYLSTQLLHSDIQIGGEKKLTPQAPLHVGVQPSVTFHYEKTEHLIEAFQNKRKSYTYSRQNSPSIAALEKQISLLENSQSSLVFSSGMAAISDTFFSLLKKGDHIITSQFLFGNTFSFFRTLERLGFEVSYVDVTQVKNVAKVMRKTTKFFFTETISNPSTLIPDFIKIAELLHGEYAKNKIISIIDNTITTPLLFQPKQLGFTFSINSLSKFISGHGNALGGSISELGNYSVGPNDEHIIPAYRKINLANSLMLQVRKKGMRDQGSTLSPYNATNIALGLETLTLRLDRHLTNAQTLAEWLDNHPKVDKVFYPGLPHHPQHDTMKKIFNGAGSLLSFTLKMKYTNNQQILNSVIKMMNRFKCIIRSTHLGDTRTIAIPVAPTIFNELGPTGRKKIGIREDLIRLSVGIEDPNDLITDLDQALNTV